MRRAIRLPYVDNHINLEIKIILGIKLVVVVGFTMPLTKEQKLVLFGNLVRAMTLDQLMMRLIRSGRRPVISALSRSTDPVLGRSTPPTATSWAANSCSAAPAATGT